MCKFDESGKGSVFKLGKQGSVSEEQFWKSLIFNGENLEIMYNYGKNLEPIRLDDNNRNPSALGRRMEIARRGTLTRLC